jgi:hypothetical protein
MAPLDLEKSDEGSTTNEDDQTTDSNSGKDDDRYSWNTDTDNNGDVDEQDAKYDWNDPRIGSAGEDDDIPRIGEKVGTGSNSSNTNVLLGAVVGCSVLLILSCAFLYYKNPIIYYKKRRKSKKAKKALGDKNAGAENRTIAGETDVASTILSSDNGSVTRPPRQAAISEEEKSEVSEDVYAHTLPVFESSGSRTDSEFDDSTLPDPPDEILPDASGPLDPDDYEDHRDTPTSFRSAVSFWSRPDHGGSVSEDEEVPMRVVDLIQMYSKSGTGRVNQPPSYSSWR